MTDWIDSEIAKTTTDYPELVILEDGQDTTFSIDASVAPRDADTQTGKTKVFIVSYKGEKRGFMLNPINPLYREILVKLKAGKKTFTIHRTGRGLKTRFELKSAI